MTDQNFKAFQEKFRPKELSIAATEHWTWSVRPAQPTLGSGVLSLNRYALELNEATEEEMRDLARIIKIIEKTLRTAFDYQIMNYLMLMMVDRHVHYHVIPRYDGSRQFAGRVWVDNGWPALPVMSDSQHKDDTGVLDAIRSKLLAVVA